MLTQHTPPGISAPSSAYSHGVSAPADARWLHVSGQVGLNPDGTLAGDGAAQMAACWTRIFAILEDAGMTKENIVKVSGRMKTNNGEALLASAIAGSGVIVQPTFICGPALCDGRLEKVLSEFQPGLIHVNAIWPENRHLSAKVRTFADFLAERFGPEPYWDLPDPENCD